MADDEDDAGFLAMDLGSSDIEEAEEPKVKVPRDYQSQEDYEAQKVSWKPTIETDELYKDLHLPISNPSKQQFQNILRAIEQLYFYRRYQDACDLAGKALEGEMVEDYRQAVLSYQTRCRAKFDEKS